MRSTGHRRYRGFLDKLGRQIAENGGIVKKLDIPTIFKSEAENLIKAHEDAKRIHSTTDIKAAGNEVEIHVREFFKRMLPKNLHVTHGHLIDANAIVSPQLDIIIADASNLPSLMTTKDGTEYIPIDSVYACGEIKSTYYKSSNYISAFSNVLSKIKNEMAHEDIPNTAYQGITDNSSIRDIFLGRGNKTLNKIYSFMLFVDAGDFNFSNVKAIYKDTDSSHLPNTSVILNSGVILFGKLDDREFSGHRYPDEVTKKEYRWFFSPLTPTGDDGSLEGNNLAYLYYSIIQHISCSYLEPPNLMPYVARMLGGRKSLIQSIDDE